VEVTADRLIALLAGLACTCAVAACGSTAATSSTTAPSTSTSGSTSTSSGPTSPSTTTAAATTGVQNLVVTTADKSALTAAFVADKNVPSQDIAGTDPGTVYYGYVPSTSTYWALASFLPTSSASQQTLVGLQDGGRTGIFTRRSGGPWTMISAGSEPFCPSRTAIPPAVRTVWGLVDSEACSTLG
jgi:hypothetical protein